VIVANITILVYFAFLSRLLLSRGARSDNGRYELVVAIILSSIWIASILGLRTGLGESLLYARIIFVFGLLVVISLANFILVLSSGGHQLSKSTKLIRMIVATTTMVVAFITLATDMVIVSIAIDPVRYLPVPQYGSFVPGYSLWIILVFILTTLKTSQNFFRADSYTKRQIRIVSISIIVSVLLALVTNVAIPAVTNNPDSALWSFIPATVLITGMSFAIIKFGLFDVRATTIRTTAYAFTIITLAIIYFLLAYGASRIFFKGEATNGVSFSPINIALALILAFIFQPIRRFFDRATNKIFYRGEYNQEEFLREFGQILSYDTDLRLLLRRASAYIAENLKSEKVFFHINGQGVFGQNGERRLNISQKDNDQLLKYYRKYHKAPEAIVTELVKDKSVEKTLLSYQAQIALPLILQDQPLGWLLIGEHKSRGYAVRDVRTLESIANELTIAIQNSLSVEEIRDLNESLQRRVDEATRELKLSNRQLQRLDEAKDEFISMASHQLRTPLTSVKGYLDMILEGDLGKISATQRAVLTEAFMSSERMVSLVSDFLNVSRLQTGKFTIERRKTDLKKVLNEELKMLAVMAKQRDLKIKKMVDKDIPPVAVDVDKLRQVISNMIDNAIYYSKPGSTIEVNLEIKGKDLVFTVKDTGIGVPKAEQAGLFGKFFRASNARKRRPDGTGVGLFLSKKVVALHGGKIIFESEENKGSTFGFSLPLAKQKVKKD